MTLAEAMRHECPKDAAEFFHVLFLNMTYRADPPDGMVECIVCGGWYEAKKPTRQTAPHEDGM